MDKKLEKEIYKFLKQGGTRYEALKKFKIQIVDINPISKKVKLDITKETLKELGYRKGQSVTPQTTKLVMDRTKTSFCYARRLIKECGYSVYTRLKTLDDIPDIYDRNNIITKHLFMKDWVERKKGKKRSQANYVPKYVLEEYDPLYQPELA